MKDRPEKMTPEKFSDHEKAQYKLAAYQEAKYVFGNCANTDKIFKEANRIYKWFIERN